MDYAAIVFGVFHRAGMRTPLDEVIRKGCLEKVVFDMDLEGWMKVQILEQCDDSES